MIHALKKESQAVGKIPFGVTPPPQPLRGEFCWRSLLGGRMCTDLNLSLQSANLQRRLQHHQNAYLGMVSGRI